MRHFFLNIVIAILPFITATAQDGYRLEYDAKFNDDFDRGRNERMHKAVLLINGDRSRFYMTSQSPYRKTGEDDHIFSPDTTMVVYTDRSSGMLLSLEYGVDGKPFIVSDSLYPMQWEITNEEKKLEDLSCIKAKCRFRGRDYIAWFAPDLPLSFGPWKMGGLPGLIVDLQDTEGNYVVKLSSMSRVSDGIELPAQVKYSIVQHISEYKRMMDRLRAGSRANASGDCLTCTGNSTYTFYLWEKIIQ